MLPWTMQNVIYHICDRKDWDAALAVGEYRADSLSSEGFIHCSTRDQVADTANKHFKGKSGLILLSLDRSAITAKVVFENLQGGSRLFPHIYGPIPIKAVRSVLPFVADQNGLFAWPQE